MRSKFRNPATLVSARYVAGIARGGFEYAAGLVGKQREAAREDLAALTNRLQQSSAFGECVATHRTSVDLQIALRFLAGCYVARREPNAVREHTRDRDEEYRERPQRAKRWQRWARALDRADYREAAVAIREAAESEKRIPRLNDAIHGSEAVTALLGG